MSSLTFFLMKRNYYFENVKPKKKVFKIIGMKVREKNYFKKFLEKVANKLTKETWILIRN